MNKYTSIIRRTSRIGLWGSVAAIILAVVFLYSPWRFYPSVHTSRWMLIVGAIIAVVGVSLTLLTVRKQIPRLRQNENLEEKLAAYSQHIRSIYLDMLAVVVIVCVLTVLSANSVLLMLAMVCTLMLMLNFPNIYRVKVDLGLTDAEMHLLYGDQYIGDEGRQ